MFNPKNTLIITDFDGTLSKRYVNGQRVSSLMSILRDSNWLSEKATQDAQAVSAHYYPLEQDPELDWQEKNQLMEEWWEKSFQIMAAGGLNQTIMDKVAQSSKLELRDGVKEFLRFTFDQQIPVIIYSAAGIGGETIPAKLTKEKVLFPNITVVSNNLKFDQHGQFIEAHQPVITSTNKTGQTLLKNNLYDNRKTEILVIGDSLDDAQMADGLTFDKIHKVVFAENNHAAFAKRFDEILDITAGFDHIMDLLKRGWGF